MVHMIYQKYKMMFSLPHFCSTLSSCSQNMDAAIEEEEEQVRLVR